MRATWPEGRGWERPSRLSGSNHQHHQPNTSYAARSSPRTCLPSLFQTLQVICTMRHHKTNNFGAVFGSSCFDFSRCLIGNKVGATKDAECADTAIGKPLLLQSPRHQRCTRTEAHISDPRRLIPLLGLHPSSPHRRTALDCDRVALQRENQGRDRPGRQARQCRTLSVSSSFWTIDTNDDRI